MYFLNYVDRNAIAQARLNNLEEDLGMSGVQFNTCVSMLVLPETGSKPMSNIDEQANRIVVSLWDMCLCKFRVTCLLRGFVPVST